MTLASELSQLIHPHYAYVATWLNDDVVTMRIGHTSRPVEYMSEIQAEAATLFGLRTRDLADNVAFLLKSSLKAHRQGDHGRCITCAQYDINSSTKQSLLQAGLALLEARYYWPKDAQMPESISGALADPTLSAILKEHDDAERSVK